VGALGATSIPVQWSYPFSTWLLLIVVAVGGWGRCRGPFVAALLHRHRDTACKYWIPSSAPSSSTPQRSPSCCGGRRVVRSARMMHSCDTPSIPASAGRNGRGSRAAAFPAAGVPLARRAHPDLHLFALSLDLILGYAGIITLVTARSSGSRVRRRHPQRQVGVADPFVQMRRQARRGLLGP